MAAYRIKGCYPQPNDADRHRLLSGYYKEIQEAGQPDAMGKMKQFACWFTHGVGNGSELRRAVHAARTPGEVLDQVERFFESQAAARTVTERSMSHEEPAHDATEHAHLEAANGA